MQLLKQPFPSKSKTLDSPRQTHRPCLVTRLWRSESNTSSWRQQSHKTAKIKPVPGISSPPKNKPRPEQSVELSPAGWGPCPSSGGVPGTRQCPGPGTARTESPSVSAGTAGQVRRAGTAGTALPGTPGTAAPAHGEKELLVMDTARGAELTSVINEMGLLGEWEW